MTGLAGESARNLIALAGEHGFVVSATQLARWHRAGLLPPPEQRPLGRGKGTESVYPPGTGQQLLALCRIHQMERRLGYVALRLWWNDYDVSGRVIRQLLFRALNEYSEAIDDMRKPGALDDTVERSPDLRIGSKLPRQARKRLGKDLYPTMMRVALEIATGSFQGYKVDPVTNVSADDQRIVEKGLGLERARVDRLGEFGPWLTGESDNALRLVSRCIHPAALRESFEHVSDADLVRARDELKVVFAILGGFGAFFEEQHGRRAFGLTLFAQLWRDGLPARQLPLLLVFWLSLRKVFGQGATQVVQSGQNWLPSSFNEPGQPEV